MNITPIAFIKNNFTEKFGIPRQSGLSSLKSKIVFLPEFSDVNALRGLEDFSHIWLIWEFSKVQAHFSPTVRPPRLGGNVRKGVFATRSPFRPNPLGLSVVKLLKIEQGVLTVSGADLMNNTPIYDIKPYLPYVECIPDASNGWALTERGEILNVDFPADLLEIIPENSRAALIEILAQDPRPQYQADEERVYTFGFGEYEVSFKVCGTTAIVVGVRER